MLQTKSATRIYVTCNLLRQWGSKGIRVNSLCPGYIKRDLIIDLLATEGKHIEDDWVKDVPMERLASS